MVFDLGSTFDDALSKGRALFAVTDYVSNLSVTINNDDANNAMFPLDRDGLSAGSLGSSIIVSVIKHNGPAGLEFGQKQMHLIGSWGASAATLTTNFTAAITNANQTIYDLNTGILGSDANGSNVYYAFALMKDHIKYA